MQGRLTLILFIIINMFMGYGLKDCTEAKPALRYPPNPNDILVSKLDKSYNRKIERTNTFF